jgi:hypothetical protein
MESTCLVILPMTLLTVCYSDTTVHKAPKDTESMYEDET